MRTIAASDESATTDRRSHCDSAAAAFAAVMSHSGIAYSPSQSRSTLDESVTDDAARGLHSDSMRTVDGFTPRMGPAGHPGSVPFFEPLLLPDGSGGPTMRHSQRQAYAASVMRGGGYAVHPNLSLNAAVNAPAGYDHSATGGDYLAFSSALGGGVGSDSSAQLSPPADAFAASLSGARWWVLFVFCLISFNQSLIWVTYSPITRKACDYYKISEAQVDLLLNWGPITNLPLLALTAKIASSTRGLRRLIMATACVELIACVLRLIPEVIAHSTLHPHSLYFLHTAQILNAAAGPSVQVTVTKLSAVWFPAESRTSSTALLFVANSLGAAAGFLLGPALVDTPGDMSRFLWLQLGLAGLGFLCAFPVLPRFYFPEKPRYFPSKAAAQMSDESAGLVRTGPDGTPLVMPGFLASVRLACGNRSFVLLVLSSGLLQGVFGCWGSVLSTVIPWLSESTCGWLSFCMSMTGVTAGVLVGPLTGHPYLRRRTKAVMLGLIAGSVACGTAFMLLTPSIFDKDPVIPKSSVWLLGVCMALLGGLVGATCPLSFELGVELTYPLPESISGGAITGVNNAASLLFLFVAPQVSGAVMTAVMAATTVVCAALLLPVKETYLRLDDEQRARGAEDGADSVSCTTPLQSDECRSARSASDTWTEGGEPESTAAGAAAASHRHHPHREDRLAAQEAAMQREFNRIMREVDAGMQPGVGSTTTTPARAFQPF